MTSPACPPDWAMIVIDPANPAHIEQLLDVYRQCEDFLALGPQPYASLEMVQADLDHSQAAGGVTYGLIDPRSGMFAVVDLISASYNGQAGDAYLALLMVAQPKRKCKVAATLLTQLEATLRENGIRRLLAHVQVNNPAGLAFFQAKGFKVTSAPALQPDGTTTVAIEKSFAD